VHGGRGCVPRLAPRLLTRCTRSVRPVAGRCGAVPLPLVQVRGQLR
jgi:hypothetical protein